MTCRKQLPAKNLFFNQIKQFQGLFIDNGTVLYYDHFWLISSL